MDNTTPELPSVAAADPPAAEIAPSDGTVRLNDLKSQLHTLRQHAQAAVERVSEYLHRLRPARGEPPPSGELVQQIFDTLENITRRQDSLEMLLQETGSETVGAQTAGGFTTDVPQWAAELQAAISNRLSEFELRLECAVSGLTVAPAADPELTAVHQRPAETSDKTEELTIVPERPSAPAAADKAAWLRVLLGSELSGDTRLKSAWDRLQQQALANDPAALLLLGQLLVFRFAEADRKPALLKEVGEAFYRYSPKTRDTPDPLEDALARWLVRQCEASGLPNSIELVHPGERFDNLRHAPMERGGVEIVQVLGWVVLRDAGRVFSKALVLTR